MTRRRRGRGIISGECRPALVAMMLIPMRLYRLRSRPMMHLAITAIDRAGSKSYYHETNDRSGNDQIPEAAIPGEQTRDIIPFHSHSLIASRRAHVRSPRERIHLMPPELSAFPPIDHGLVGFEIRDRSSRFPSCAVELACNFSKSSC